MAQEAGVAVGLAVFGRWHACSRCRVHRGS